MNRRMRRRLLELSSKRNSLRVTFRRLPTDPAVTFRRQLGDEVVATAASLPAAEQWLRGYYQGASYAAQVHLLAQDVR